MIFYLQTNYTHLFCGKQNSSSFTPVMYKSVNCLKNFSTMANSLDGDKEIAIIDLPVGVPSASDWAIFTTDSGETKKATFPQFISALTVVLERIDVASYAAAVPFFTGTQPRRVFVAHDESYGELINGEYESQFYDYWPGLGVALLGIDFNYTEE